VIELGDLGPEEPAGLVDLRELVDRAENDFATLGGMTIAAGGGERAPSLSSAPRDDELVLDDETDEEEEEDFDFDLVKVTPRTVLETD